MIVAGTDEAGRGPLAGPVVAAAAVLNSCQMRELMRPLLINFQFHWPAIFNNIPFAE